MKKLNVVCYALLIAFVVWVGASFIDINSHNNPFDSDYKDYSSANFFLLLEKCFEW